MSLIEKLAFTLSFVGGCGIGWTITVIFVLACPLVGIWFVFGMMGATILAFLMIKDFMGK